MKKEREAQGAATEKRKRRETRRQKKKQKKAAGMRRQYSERFRSVLRTFYAAQIVLLSAFLLLLGIYYARAGSERTWHGTTPALIDETAAGAWLQEKWDLFFASVSDTIFR